MKRDIHEIFSQNIWRLAQLKSQILLSLSLACAAQAIFYARTRLFEQSNEIWKHFAVERSVALEIQKGARALRKV